MTPRRPASWAIHALRVALASVAVAVVVSTAAAQADDDAAGDLLRRGNMTIARGASTLYAVTHRAGLFGFLGHEHAITMRDWSATLCWIEDSPDASFLDVRVPTSSVRLDTERGLELAGLESSPDPGTIEDLQAEMLSGAYLDAASFPELRFVSTSVARADEDAPEGVDLRVEGALTIHGQTQPVSFPVRIVRDETGPFTFSAHVAFRMTDFGITPENTAGVVAVADEMDLYVDLVARRTQRDCRR